MTKAADISKEMTLGEATVDKLEAIEDNNKIVDTVGKLTNTRMAEILVVYIKTFRVQTAKETLRLDFIVVMNASGFFKNGAVV